MDWGHPKRRELGSLSSQCRIPEASACLNLNPERRNIGDKGRNLKFYSLVIVCGDLRIVHITAGYWILPQD